MNNAPKVNVTIEINGTRYSVAASPSRAVADFLNGVCEDYNNLAHRLADEARNAYENENDFEAFSRTASDARRTKDWADAFGTAADAMESSLENENVNE